MNDNEKIIKNTIDGGKAFAVISILTQAVSWVFTFIVIRLLDPQDYGLMAMAAFITSFIHVFSNLGLGAGIVQRKTVTDHELSSVFWFSILVGVILTGVGYFLAYPNAYIFSRDELIPITQLSALLFLVTAIATVPQNILSREYRFKDIAKVNFIASFVSSIASVAMALMEFGVYTLVLSSILLRLISSLGYLYMSGWKPTITYRYQEVRSFLKFGVILSLAAGFQRLLEALDKLIIGKLYSPTQLGYYSTGISIAGMAIDKISPLINPVVFPMFSRWQEDHQRCRSAYLKVLKYYLLLMSPLYIGGIMTAPNLILIVLGQKWAPMTLVFQVFCAVNLVKVLSSYHTILMTSQGKAGSILKFEITMLVLLLLGIYFSALNSFNYVLVAWVVIVPVTAIFWILITIKCIAIKPVEYLRTVFSGTIAAFGMGAGLIIVNQLIIPMLGVTTNFWELMIQLLAGAIMYITIVIFFQKKLIVSAFNTLIKRKEEIV